MAQTVCVIVCPLDRDRLEAIVGDCNASTFYIAANYTGGARGQMGYIFASLAAPVECRITARNDAYFGDRPKDAAIQ